MSLRYNISMGGNIVLINEHSQPIELVSGNGAKLARLCWLANRALDAERTAKDYRDTMPVPHAAVSLAGPY